MLAFFICDLLSIGRMIGMAISMLVFLMAASGISI